MRDRDIAVATPPGVVAPPIVEESDSPHQFESEMVVSDFLDCSVDESIGQQRHRPPASRRPPGPANEALHAYFVLLSSFGAFVLFALAFQKGRSGDEPRGAKASVGRRQRRRPSEKRPPRGATKGRLARSIGGTVAPVAPFALAPAAPALLVLLGIAWGSSRRESADGGGGGGDPPSFAPLGSFVFPVVRSLVNDLAVPLYAAAALVYLLVLANIRKGRSGEEPPPGAKASVGRRPRRSSEEGPPATKGRLVRSISGTVAPVTAIGKGKEIQKQRTIDETTGGEADDNVVVASGDEAPPLEHLTIHSGPTASSSSDQESFLDDGDEAVNRSTKAERIRFLNARDGNVEDAKDMLREYLKWRNEMGLDDAAAPAAGGAEADVDGDCKTIWDDCARRAIDHHSSRNDPEEPASSSPDDDDPDRKLPCVAFLDPESSPDVVRTVDDARTLQHLPARIDLTLAPGPTYALAIALYLDATLDRDRTEKCCVLIDVRSGTGWANVPAIKLVSYIKLVAKLLNDLHPERLDRCILYPFPRVATAIWGMVKPFLDPDTARKVVLLAGSARTDSKPPMKGLLMHFEEGTVERLERRRLEQFHPPPC